MAAHTLTVPVPRYLSQFQYIKPLQRRAESGDYRVHGDPQTATCVVIPSFGQKYERGYYLPGESNLALARVALERFSHLPLLPQWEVHNALYAFGAADKAPACIGKYGEKMHTQHVAQRAVRAMHYLGLVQSGGGVIVLAHQHHMPRAVATIQAELPPDMHTIAPADLDIPWDPESTHKWTRGPEAWPRREMPAIALFAVRGWLEAG